MNPHFSGILIGAGGVMFVYWVAWEITLFFRRRKKPKIVAPPFQHRPLAHPVEAMMASERAAKKQAEADTKFRDYMNEMNAAVREALQRQYLRKPKDGNSEDQS